MYTIIIHFAVYRYMIKTYESLYLTTIQQHDNQMLGTTI